VDAKNASRNRASSLTLASSAWVAAAAKRSSSARADSGTSVAANCAIASRAPFSAAGPLWASCASTASRVRSPSRNAPGGTPEVRSRAKLAKPSAAWSNAANAAVWLVRAAANASSALALSFSACLRPASVVEESALLSAAFCTASVARMRWSRIGSTLGRAAAGAAPAPWLADSRVPISQSFQRLSASFSSRSEARASFAAPRSTARDLT
jgi:hypothetical protein